MPFKIDYEWVPQLRMRWVEPNGRDFGDNPGFRDWLTSRSPREQLRLYQLPNGILSRRDCYRMWRWLGRTDPVPHALQMFLNREDFERMFAELEK